MPQNIQLIIGSTRENRIGKSIAEWVVQQAKDNDVNLQVIDLKAINLPNFNAPIPPSRTPVTTEAGKAWASKIAQGDAYIFLTPEYNRSIPSSLKNALDYLVTEWKEKPATIISYGYIDGGSNATKHLTDILGWLKIDIRGKLNLELSKAKLDENGQIADIHSDLAPYENPFATMLNALVNTRKPEVISV